MNAIVAQWNFPTSVMVPLLCREQGPPSRDSILKCEYKYSSRLEQQKVILEHVPRFCSIDAFPENPFNSLSFYYPYLAQTGQGLLLPTRLSGRK